MKAIKAMIIILLSAPTLVFPATGLAGMQLRSQLRVSVPFKFLVGKTELPAGKYLVDRVTPNVIVIRNTENWKAVTTLTFGGESKAEPPRAQLVFHRYQEKYFLARIWDGANTTAHQLPRTEAQREVERLLQRHITRREAKPVVVSVIADPTS